MKHVILMMEIIKSVMSETMLLKMHLRFIALKSYKIINNTDKYGIDMMKGIDINKYSQLDLYQDLR
jgi:hypothetical protein